MGFFWHCLPRLFYRRERQNNAMGRRKKDQEGSCSFYVNAPEELVRGGVDLFGRCNKVCLFLSFLISSHAL